MGISNGTQGAMTPIKCMHCANDLLLVVKRRTKVAKALFGIFVCVLPAVLYLAVAYKRDADFAKAGVPEFVRRAVFWNGTLSSRTLQSLDASQAEVVRAHLETVDDRPNRWSALEKVDTNALMESRGGMALGSILAALWVVMAVFGWRWQQGQSERSAYLICEGCQIHYSCQTRVTKE